MLLLGCALATAAAGSAPPQASRSPVAKEVRGVWVVRTDVTSPASVSKVVAAARKNGLNTLFVQVRGRGDAYYRSELEPRAQALAKVGEGFDPLSKMVADGHAAGLQVHAWVNACYVWSDKNAPLAPGHIVRARKDWLAVRCTGDRCMVGNSEVFICPGNPEARAHLVAVCRDIAKRYEVDGIQLDYIRYANKDLCYCNGCLDRFSASLNGAAPSERLAELRAKSRTALPNAYQRAWLQFRRDQITSLVREIRAAVKAERSQALLSAAVIAWGGYPGSFERTEAYNQVGQDWYGWIREGLVDAVCPMTYQKQTAGFGSWVRAVGRTHPDFPVWYGIGAYLFSSDSAAAKVEAVRKGGGKGWVLFSYTSVTRSGTNDAYLRNLKARVMGPTTARTPARATIN
jgi:uncharacterized lipoprotein YddW (UPF0748 family)